MYNLNIAVRQNGQQYFFVFSQQNLTKSNRHPNAIRSGGGRNLIRRRTESDWAAFG